MAIAIATAAQVASEIYEQADPNEPRRDWLTLSNERLDEVGRRRGQFWLVLTFVNAPDRRRAVFRVPGRDFPFLVTGGASDLPISSMRMFTTASQLTARDIPIYTIAGGSDLDRRQFLWRQPLMIKPQEAWRIEVVFEIPPIGASYLVLSGVKFERKKRD